MNTLGLNTEKWQFRLPSWSEKWYHGSLRPEILEIWWKPIRFSGMISMAWPYESTNKNPWPPIALRLFFRGKKSPPPDVLNIRMGIPIFFPIFWSVKSGQSSHESVPVATFSSSRSFVADSRSFARLAISCWWFLVTQMEPWKWRMDLWQSYNVVPQFVS